MRRPSGLAVDTTVSDIQEEMTPNDFNIYSPESKLDIQSTITLDALPSADPPHTYTPPKPSVGLLFSLVSRRDVYCLLLPALFSSLISGGIAPFMTYVIGQSFDAFAAFPLTPNPPESAKRALLNGVGLAAIELVALAVGALVLSSITSCLWIWVGERNVMRLRTRVYESVTQKEMIWFDTKLGSEGSVQSVAEGPVGAGGLMAQFAKETDEVRMASSLASGFFIQYFTTSLASLLLAFTRSYSLTLVILSAVPALILLQALSQSFVIPRLTLERQQTSIAATLVDRAISAISTVKAFNASHFELDAISEAVEKVRKAAKKCNLVFGISSGAGQFVMMGMFVQGFWFGSRLVREGKASAGDVMAVFWACLIATSNLQMCLPQLVVITKGQSAMASLVRLVEEPTEVKPTVRSSTTLLNTLPIAKRKPSMGLKRRPTQFRRIVPTRCTGEFSLQNVTFAYPSRPTIPVLNDVSLYLPANETTFIVGGSGSGKSTIAALLLRLYDPQQGCVQLDDQDIGFLDEGFMREHVACVSQGCILFDMTVHDNVAMGVASSSLGGGRRPEDVTREEVVEACRVALMYEFVRDLPDGYDTMLGSGGAGLSGGQKQRLAIARAKLRNPSVLVLDEATSALDATSRLLVFEAIKKWRGDKTTIVITHDLSQIEKQDFVYVLKDGSVVEQGFRYDLETNQDGEFKSLMEAQSGVGGLPPKSDEAEVDGDGGEREEVERILEEAEVGKGERRLTMGRPLTLGNWMFDAVADLTAVKGGALGGERRVSRFVPAEAFAPEPTSESRSRRPSSLYIPDIAPPLPSRTTVSRRLSLQFSPTSPKFGRRGSSVIVDREFEVEKVALEKSGIRAAESRVGGAEKKVRARWDGPREVEMVSVKVDEHKPEGEQAPVQAEAPLTFWALLRAVYPTIPNKPMLFFGLTICVISGAMTPIFSFLLSKLMFEVSIGATNVSTINAYGGIVLGVAALDGLFMGTKFIVMETLAMNWVTRVRKSCAELVLAQDKKYFDKPENSSVALMNILIKDGDDARTLIATVVAQCLVVCAMLGVGLIWALVRGWQFTLVGFAIAPVFVVTMAVQTNLVARFEFRNKRAREGVAKTYYDVISNIKGIRSMGFEGIFQRQFEETVEEALSTGVRGAFVEGCTYGVASALIYLSEALLFYVGAVLIARGTYTYLQMVETLNLMIFSVSLGSQLMSFTQRIAKSTQATRDFNRLMQLSYNTDESRGQLKPVVEGNVAFKNVSFSYPERPDVQILKNVSLELRPGECVAIVGGSGSGKSTIAALLQRLYEPQSGAITIGETDVRAMNVDYLRDHVAVVSQNPNLFDASISDNIAYGTSGLSKADIEFAAQAAHVHEFIHFLPKGYDTMLGENASLISGGQAQRIQIARALARPCKILILDECTSALDSHNQIAVLDTIRDAKVGRTTLMVTHKLPVMQMCDRILVVHDGAVVEDGSYYALMEKNGVFASLASAGEWSGE
ncbi:hypothetical protein JAAARDRAFT_40847 [Jaapia argillacea MUCL 33604]|uniref:P-loop containing nucleoside triphosphate hydrolase protein n=1 Tax=Jaapia argillacea MUCL 33604 TaxID=933084 RepID=A0A067PKR4_9AGAM|nr:hypothetical protein JAAARDRAFT_40847 [Jaapia argillacea MUCL 33604]